MNIIVEKKNLKHLKEKMLKENTPSFIYSFTLSFKKIIYLKYERQVNPNLLCKFGHFWRKLKYLDAHNAPFERPQRQNAIWCDIKCYDHYLF